MNLNKVASELIFNGSSIKSLKITNNIVNLANTNNSIEMSLDIKKIDEIPQEEKRELKGYLLLNLTVTTKDQEDPSLKCKFVITVEGCFSSWMEDREIFERMLYLNGGTTLYSIARAQILNFSSNVFMSGKILLPLINMIEFINQKEKEENQNKQ